MSNEKFTFLEKELKKCKNGVIIYVNGEPCVKEFDTLIEPLTQKNNTLEQRLNKIIEYLKSEV